MRRQYHALSFLLRSFGVAARIDDSAVGPTYHLILPVVAIFALKLEV